MRALVLADIHSNYQALTAVVQDAHARGPVDAVWCLGDVVGYGPDPGRCVQFLREQKALAVAGNHDLATIGRVPLDDFNAFAVFASRWNALQLNAEERAYLDGLPQRLEEGLFILAHGSPRDPIWEYVHSEEVAEANFAHFSTRCCLIGHTHIPLVFVEAEGEIEGQHCLAYRPVPGEALSLKGFRLIYNPGGVGQPRDGDPRAAYAVYDADSETLTHYRVPYEVAATQGRMAAAGLPEFLINRLARGR